MTEKFYDLLNRCVTTSVEMERRVIISQLQSLATETYFSELIQLVCENGLRIMTGTTELDAFHGFAAYEIKKNIIFLDANLFKPSILPEYALYSATISNLRHELAHALDFTQAALKLPSVIQRQNQYYHLANALVNVTIGFERYGIVSRSLLKELNELFEPMRQQHKRLFMLSLDERPRNQPGEKTPLPTLQRLEMIESLRARGVYKPSVFYEEIGLRFYTRYFPLEHTHLLQSKGLLEQTHNLSEIDNLLNLSPNGSRPFVRAKPVLEPSMVKAWQSLTYEEQVVLDQLFSYTSDLIRRANRVDRPVCFNNLMICISQKARDCIDHYVECLNHDYQQTGNCLPIDNFIHEVHGYLLEFMNPTTLTIASLNKMTALLPPLELKDVQCVNSIPYEAPSSPAEYMSLLPIVCEAKSSLFASASTNLAQATVQFDELLSEEANHDGQYELEALGYLMLESTASTGLILLVNDVILNQGYSSRAASWGSYVVSQAFNGYRILRSLYQGASYMTALMPAMLSSLTYHGLTKLGLVEERTAGWCSNSVSVAASYYTGGGFFSAATHLAASGFVSKLVAMGEGAFANRYLVSGLKSKVEQFKRDYDQLSEAQKQCCSAIIEPILCDIENCPSMRHYAQLELLHTKVHELATKLNRSTGKANVMRAVP